MTKRKYIKLLMAGGMSRNEARRDALRYNADTVVAHCTPMMVLSYATMTDLFLHGPRVGSWINPLSGQIHIGKRLGVKPVGMPWEESGCR